LPQRREPFKAADPVGREAFERELAFLAPRILVGEDSPEIREVARVVSKARQWVEAGDYLAAIHALSSIEIQITTQAAGPKDGKPPKIADIEQALGDLRRAIRSDPDRPHAAAALSLWSAAREEIIRGSWTAAWALIQEANARLAKGRS
jgi:hypothetical protein